MFQKEGRASHSSMEMGEVEGIITETNLLRIRGRCLQSSVVCSSKGLQEHNRNSKLRLTAQQIAKQQEIARVAGQKPRVLARHGWRFVSDEELRQLVQDDGHSGIDCLAMPRCC